jgi:hypothetical protein
MPALSFPALSRAEASKGADGLMLALSLPKGADGLMPALSEVEGPALSAHRFLL